MPSSTPEPTGTTTGGGAPNPASVRFDSAAYTPASVRFDSVAPASVRFDSPPVPQSVRFDSQSPASLRFDSLPIVPLSVRFDSLNPASIRFDSPPIPQSVRFDSQMPASGPGTFPAPDAAPPPALFRGAFYDGHSGKLTFDCDFTITGQAARTLDAGYATTGGGEVFRVGGGGGQITISVFGMTFTISASAFGTCTAQFVTTLAELWANYARDPNGSLRVYGGCPLTSLYDTGPGHVDDADPATGGTGHLFIQGVDYGPFTSGAATISGSLSCYIKLAEYKQAGQDLTFDGMQIGTEIIGAQGEPIGVLTYTGYSFPMWEWGYSLTINGAVANFTGFSPALPMSGAYGVGERYLYSNSGPTIGDLGDTLAGVTYDTTDGMGGIRYAQPEATAYISAGGGYIDAQNNGSAFVTNINFNSGAWSPVPYAGRRVNQPFASVQAGVGFISGVHGTLGVLAASTTPAHLFGRIYAGDRLFNGTLQLRYGSGGQRSLTVPSHPHTTFVTVVNGVCDTYIPQIRSFYDGGTEFYSGSPFVYTPPLPSDRDDYTPNYVTLVLNSAVDPTIFALDDYSWTPTTFHQAQSIKVEDFGDVTRWRAQHGTVGGPALTMTATADNYLAISPTAFGAGRTTTPTLAAWDARNYRYWQMTVTSSRDGGPLTLTLNGNRHYTTPALKEGSNTVVIDLCNPNNARSPGLTRTGFDTQPDFKYGVQGVDTLTIAGVANGQTVTIGDITLIRKDANAPGSVYQETTGYPFIQEALWFPPDVPAGGSVDDDLYQGLNNRNHLYARQLRTYSDGKPAADIPHAIGQYPFLVPGTKFPNYAIRPAERLMITDFVAAVNAQTGLSCSPPQDGVPGLPGAYQAASTAAVWLTRDNYITADGDGVINLAPHPPDANMDGAQLTCRLQYDAVKNYPGQFRALEWAFLKRLFFVYEGLVVMPDGSSAAGVSVSLVPVSNDVIKAPPLTTKCAANGYFRFPNTPYSPVVISTLGDSGATVWGHDRACSWIGLTGPVTSQLTPSNLQDHWGRYHRVLSASGNITYWRSDFASPAGTTWAVSALQITAGGTDAYPRLAFDTRGILTCVFQRKSGSGSSATYDIYRTVSWDDGATWNEAHMAIAGGKYTANAVGVDGMYLEAAYVPNSDQGAHPGGTLQARSQGLGEQSLSDVYTFQDGNGNNLAAADDTFGLSQGKSGAALWLLHFVVAGETKTSDWFSSDLNAQSWTRIPDGS